MKKKADYYLTYIDGQQFKKVIYPHKDKKNYKIVYYPENKLFTEVGEGVVFFNLLSRKYKKVYKFKLSGKKEIQIVSISSSSKSIKIKNIGYKLPVTLVPGDTIRLGFTFNPERNRLKEKDTITIITSEPNIPPYKIYLAIIAAHINKRNIGKISDLKLSKRKDKFQIISSFEARTEISINDKKMNNYYSEYLDNNKSDTLKVPLFDLKVGKYELNLINDEIEKKIELEITK